MKVIKPGNTFVASGAVVLEMNELATTIHALIEERDRVARAKGNQYGKMTLSELVDFISKLQEYQKEKGA